MTTPGIDSIGYCVSYTEQGDWAFDLALKLARRDGLQLNIFQFLSDPYAPVNNDRHQQTDIDQVQAAIDAEREMRLYYDEKLGAFLDVGFRLCERNEWTELHRCLCKREFQLLVLARPRPDAVFGTRTLTDFAEGFVCPVLTVGPGSSSEIELNPPARLISYRLELDQVVHKKKESTLDLESQNRV